MKRLFTSQVKQRQAKITESLQPYEGIQLSDEQIKYVEHEFDQNKDSILIACAGSGKTMCMLQRMQYLAKRQILTKDQMMIFSFSKQTIEHTKNCSKKYQDSRLFADDKLIMTIDSFCYQVIKKTLKDKEACDKNILSTKLHNMIQTNNEDLTKFLKRSSFKKIKILFIDEAQDLNQIQYDIIIFLQKLLGYSLNFIGDPNQNIYQFNGSFEKFMLNHNPIKSKSFDLNRNFRSNKQIEEFSEYFKYYQSRQYDLALNSVFNKQQGVQQICTDQINIDSQDTNSDQNSTKTKLNNTKINLNNIDIYVEQQQINDQLIHKLINQLKDEGYQLKNIAFLSPIIGDQYNSGIKRIANILDRNHIPYIGYYQESKDVNKKNTSHNIKQAVNLFTIHGSKGLEYDVVVLIKFSDKMMIVENYEHSNFIAQNMNLLYVAITRAKKKLIIIHDDSENIYKKHVCSLLTSIPNHLYNSTSDLDSHFKVVNKKLENRKKIIDDSQDYVKNNQIADLKDILLISKQVLPDLFDLHIKEGMFQNTNFQWKTCVTRFIQGIDKEDLLQLDEFLKFKKRCTDIFPVSDQDSKHFKQIKLNNEALVGILLEQLFFYQIQYHKQNTPKVNKILFTLKDQQKLGSQIVKINQFFLISNVNQLDTIYEGISNMQKQPQESQNQLFFDNMFRDISTLNTLSKDQYQQEQQINNYQEHLDFGTISLQQLDIIMNNKQNIFDAIYNYNQGLHYSQCLDSIIYICCLKYAIKSKHAKYIQYNHLTIQLLRGFSQLLENLDKFTKTLINYDVLYQFEVDNQDIIGFIDFIFIDPETNERSIIEFKTTNDLSIEHIIQIIIYDYLLNLQNEGSINDRLIIINAIKGVQYEINVENKEPIFDLLTKMFQKDKNNRCSSI